MCSLRTAARDMLPKMAERSMTMRREKMPPVNVLNSGYYWYRMSWVVEKKSALWTADFNRLSNFIYFLTIITKQFELQN